jgi:group I intron endonuclease
MGYLYTLTSPSFKSYVGLTTRTMEERLKEHQEPASGCRAISNAIQKYGLENFVVDYYECPDDELNHHERWMVNLMGTLSPGGYNLREGGGSRGKFSDETKRKMSEDRMGINTHGEGVGMSDRTKQKIQDIWTEEKRKNHGLQYCGAGNPMFGKPRDEETKEKLRSAWTDEKREQASEIRTGDKNPMFGVRGEEHPWWGRSHTEETIQKNKASQPNSERVYQYELNGTYIQSFESYREAGRYIKDDDAGTPISRCARGRQKTSYGFVWSNTPPN